MYELIEGQDLHSLYRACYQLSAHVWPLMCCIYRYIYRGNLQGGDCRLGRAGATLLRAG